MKNRVSVCLLVLALGVQLNHALGRDGPIGMFGLINTLYFKADMNADGIISKEELDSVYQGFDTDGDKKVYLSEFAPLWKELSGQSDEFAKAYFLLADLDGNGEISSESDVDPTYKRFDTNDDDQVQAQEFNLKWQEVYQEAPLIVLMERANTDSDLTLSPTEYAAFFSSLGKNADGSVAKADFLQSWTDGYFGRQEIAEKLFSAVDADNDGIITTSETSTFMSALDISNDGKLQVLEIAQIVGNL